MSDKRVLVVDDDPRICRIIERVAADLGIAIKTIANPEEEFLREIFLFAPTIIIVDLQMPRMDGVELLRLLAQEKSASAIVLCSGLDRSVIETSEELGKSFGLNMVDILTKPFDIDQIRDLLLREFGAIVEHHRESPTFSEEELSHAIGNKELIVHYQPQVELATDEVVGVEALVRWQHPTHGLVFPDDFIPLAESSNTLIRELTYAVLQTILSEEQFQREDLRKLNISINLSARMLGDLRLPDQFGEIMEKHGVSPSKLLIEVTESGAMEDASLTMDILTRFRIKGFKLSLDDFGTGYSSMVQLNRFPFNEIKIDKSFVMNAMRNEEAASIVNLTIDLGHRLGLSVVAEGVEDKATYDWLNSLECEIGQGYFISKALAPDDFVKWYDEYQLNRVSAEP